MMLIFERAFQLNFKPSTNILNSFYLSIATLRHVCNNRSQRLAHLCAHSALAQPISGCPCSRTASPLGQFCKSGAGYGSEGSSSQEDGRQKGQPQLYFAYRQPHDSLHSETERREEEAIYQRRKAHPTLCPTGGR